MNLMKERSTRSSGKQSTNVVQLSQRRRDFAEEIPREGNTDRKMLDEKGLEMGDPGICRTDNGHEPWPTGCIRERLT